MKETEKREESRDYTKKEKDKDYRKGRKRLWCGWKEREGAEERRREEARIYKLRTEA